MSTAHEKTATSADQTEGAAAPAGEPEEVGRARLDAQGLLARRRSAQASYVFDLRDEAAWRIRHLPGAYNLPFALLAENIHRLPFSGDLLFYDGGEGLARQAARLLHDNGFAEFWYLEEGLDALMEALEASPDEVKYDALPREQKAAAVEKVLDERIREFLARDGGGLDVVAIEDDRVLVSYQGACGGCSSSTAGTLRFIQGALTVALNHEIQVEPVEP
ncbi:MAG: NifU family protein [Candidatus Lambdaproteobacteria bacterium]|nr:NifU family protein [Candidatus Lambdaproteobacteria bacterium]